MISPLGLLAAVLASASAAAGVLVLLATGELRSWAAIAGWAIAGTFALWGTVAAATRCVGRLGAAWQLWSAAIVLWLVGTLLRSVHALAAGPEELTVLADACWLSFALLTTVGLAFRAAPGTSSVHVLALDAIPVVLLLAALASVWGSNPVDTSMGHDAFHALYPIVFALPAVISLHLAVPAGSGRASASSWLLAGGFVLLALASVSWSLGGNQSTAGLWSLGLVVVGLAGFRRAQVPEKATDLVRVRRESPAQVAPPAIAILSLILLGLLTDSHEQVIGAFLAVGVTAFATRFFLVRRDAGMLLEAVQESEQRFRTLFESAAIGIAVTDADARIVASNPVLQRLLGYSEHELGDLSFRDLTHPEDPDPDLAAMRSELAEGRDTYRTEKRLVRRNGSELWAELAGSAVWASGGKPVLWMEMVQDISARKQAEAELLAAETRFRSLVEQLPLVTYIDRPDSASSSLYVSPQIEQILGHPVEAWLDRDLQLFPQVLHPDDRERVLAESLEADATGEPYLSEYRLLASDGRAVWFRDAAEAVRDAEGRIVYWQGFMLDISEQRHLEEQLRHSQKMQAIGQLAGGVAHDFNNLLTVISGYGELLLGELDDETPAWKRVEEIKRATERATSLTQRLLAFSRRQVLQPRLIDLNQVVTGLQSMLQRLIGEDISLGCVPGLETGLVKADPGQIEQVIVNLVLNARDAMPGGGALTISTGSVEGPDEKEHVGLGVGSYVVLSVADTGIGMDEDTRSRVFEPFFTTKEPGKGTGLGLATVYGIVEQSGGHVSVYSAPGEGTTVTVFLPRVASSDAQVETPALSSGPPAGTETVLLAEDEPVVRRLVREILERSGYTVLEAASGLEAFDVAERQGTRIDLVLTDVVMPDMSGRELVGRLSERWPDLRIVYMSGYPGGVLGDAEELDPGTTFLQKPFPITGLAAIVRDVLDGPPPSRAAAA